MKIQIAPSILSADFGKLNADIATVEPYVDLLHVDIMDGHFVPNITMGPPVVKNIQTKLPVDLHLMIEHPEMYIEEFVKAATANGLSKDKVSVTVHQEACKHLHRVIQLIKSFGVKAAVSINPGTPVEMIKDVLGDLDMVLIMSVNPGFGGQKFIPVALDKIREIRKLKPDLDIEVDGGINAETAKLCVEAGANILVAGSYIFGAEDRQKAIESLRM
ncbi:ribulose-phosphate 3-epimerase [Candidatus Peregrinibacteria bacterium]|nr:ribulose-phosphate 3-epimerase [Candidatus Peregrinibacteria bacterium]